MPVNSVFVISALSKKAMQTQFLGDKRSITKILRLMLMRDETEKLVLKMFFLVNLEKRGEAQFLFSIKFGT